MGSLKGKVGVVTGGGRGIGRAIALALAKEGADVAIWDVDVTSAEATAAEIKTSGMRSMAIQCDVAVWEDVRKAATRVVSELGGIDILINNAGLGTMNMVEDMDKSDWDYVMGVNLNGCFHCSKAVIEPMKKRGGGNIINLSSLAGKRIALMQGANYTASKAGILGFTRHLAYELGPFNIRVNAICPGTVITPFVEKWSMPEFREKLRSMVPLQRLGAPEDIADVAIFLVSDKARMVTGVDINVDGGQAIALLDWETYLKSRKNPRGE